MKRGNDGIAAASAVTGHQNANERNMATTTLVIKEHHIQSERRDGHSIQNQLAP